MSSPSAATRDALDQAGIGAAGSDGGFGGRCGVRRFHSRFESRSALRTCHFVGCGFM